MGHSGKCIGGGGRGLQTLARSRNEPLVKTCNRSLEVRSFSGSRSGKNGKIACVFINVQSLRSKFDEFQCFVNCCEARYHLCDGIMSY